MKRFLSMSHALISRAGPACQSLLPVPILKEIICPGSCWFRALEATSFCYCFTFPPPPRTNGNIKYVLEALRFPKQRQKGSKHRRSLFSASNNTNIYIKQYLECQTVWPFPFMLFTARASGWGRDREPDGALVLSRGSERNLTRHIQIIQNLFKSKTGESIVQS